MAVADLVGGTGDGARSMRCFWLRKMCATWERTLHVGLAHGLGHGLALGLPAVDLETNPFFSGWTSLRFER